MKKEVIIPIIIIIMIIGVIGFFILTDGSSNSKQTNSKNITESGTIDNSGNIKVGALTFSMIDGYKKGETNPAGHISITNGTNKICFASFKNGDIEKLSKDYVNYIGKKNQTATKSELTINDMPVIKYENDETKASHYWFEYKGTVYRIYNDVGTLNDDENFEYLISTMKTS